MRVTVWHLESVGTCVMGGSVLACHYSRPFFLRSPRRSQRMNLFPPPSFATGPPPSPGLPPLPRPLDTDRPIRWLGDDGRNVFIEIQGQLACVAFRHGPLSAAPPVRQEIRGFSAASRLRLFKTINRLDFSAAGRCTFMTTTWRDEVGRPDKHELTRVRSAFQKAIERMAGCGLPGIWRVEWKKRKSGRYVGQVMPHVHVIYFKIPYLDKIDITAAWARAIGWKGQVSCKVKGVKNLRMTLSYVSKYIAKIDDLSNLDIVSYLARIPAGRAWGIYRKDLMPMADRTLIRVLPGQLVYRIRQIAIAAYAKTPVDDETGFCVFGPASEEIGRLVDEYCLTCAME
jgi:hypothetical protein